MPADGEELTADEMDPVRVVALVFAATLYRASVCVCPVIVIQSLAEVAFHEQSDCVTTPIMPVPPLAGTSAEVGLEIAALAGLVNDKVDIVYLDEAAAGVAPKLVAYS